MEDSSFSFYCIDAIEHKVPGTVLLFGKTERKKEEWETCCLVVKNVKRRMFIIPRKGALDEIVEKEVLKLLGSTAFGVNTPELEWRESKGCPFENDMEKRNAQRVLCVRYGFDHPRLPPEPAALENVLKIYGAGGPLEVLTLDNRFHGTPNWHIATKSTPVNERDRVSTCTVEVQCDHSNFMIYGVLGSTTPPTVSILSISLDFNEKGEATRFYGLLRKEEENHEEGRCVFLNESSCTNNGSNNTTYSAVEKGKDILSELVKTIAFLDPDVLLFHNPSQDFLQTILKNGKVVDKRLGRLIKPISSYGTFGTVGGRLVCNTFRILSELLPRSRTFDLRELTKVHLSREMDFPYRCEEVARIQLELVSKLRIISLTRQFSTLCFCPWSVVLGYGRHRRLEFLLLFEFNKRNYLVPDPHYTRSEGGDVEEGSSYFGGLVLEPMRGLYDTAVILLDFASLYPSIIIQHKICFTTQTPSLTSALSHNKRRAKSTSEFSSGGEGILPQILSRFMERRNIVKALINQQGEGEMTQLDVEQEALKTTANSIYGCLAFKSFRFQGKHLASAITEIGRSHLCNTIFMIQEQFPNMRIIYGDTDSLMIDTMQKDAMQAYSLADKFVEVINNRHPILRIKVDGIFTRTLLLRKKKYAFVKKYANGKIETKGIESASREYCILAQEIIQKVLQEILSPTKGKEDEDEMEEKNGLKGRIIASLEQCAFWMDEDVAQCGMEELRKYIIYSALKKDPEKYQKEILKSNPHARLALQRKPHPGKRGEVIGYIICQGDNNLSPLERAQPPEDVEAAEGSLLVDIQWYLETQILPPIERICTDFIPGFKRSEIGAALGLSGIKERKKVSQNKGKKRLDIIVEEGRISNNNNDRVNFSSLFGDMSV